MSAAAVSNRSQATLARLAGLGALAGLDGGLVFGIMMAMGGMLPMVANSASWLRSGWKHKPIPT